MPKGFPIQYTDEMVNFLKNNTHMLRGEMTRLFNEKFGTDVSQRTLNAKCERLGALTGRTGHFKKGSSSWNKGLKLKGMYCYNGFKKGNVPHNHKPIGYERITKDGYVEVKVAEPKKFKLKHRVIWEKANGEVPKKHVIRFKDGNKNNLDLDNLVCIPLGANAVLNKKFKHAEAPIEVKPMLITMAQIGHKISKQGKNKCKTVN